MQILKWIMIGVITTGVNASATGDAMAQGAQNAASSIVEENLEELRRGGGGRSFGGSYSRNSTRTSYRGYGRSYGSYMYYSPPPSTLGRIANGLNSAVRSVERNVLRPLDHATRDARREVENVVANSVAVHVSALFGPKLAFMNSMLALLPNAETCKVPEFTDCVMKKGQNKFVMPSASRENLFTGSCAQENGCQAPGQMGTAAQVSFQNFAQKGEDLFRATRRFTREFSDSVGNFLGPNMARLIEMSAGMYTGQIKDILVKQAGCPEECVNKHIDNPTDWSAMFNYCQCKQSLPWTQADEMDAIQASDLYLVSMREWVERASQVTEEEYNQSPLAEQLNAQFGNPFQTGLYYSDVMEEQEVIEVIEE